MKILAVQTVPELEAFLEVEQAALEHHFDGLPADPLEDRVPLLDGVPVAGELTRMWVGRLDDGTPVGSLIVNLPLLDNLQTANVDAAVHPAHARQGLGRELLAFALDVVRSEGRSQVYVEAPYRPDGTEGFAFGMLRAAGGREVLTSERQLLDLHAFPPVDPDPAPDGYHVVQWLDRAPDHLVAGCAYLIGRMRLDAPSGDSDMEQEFWDADRYRASEQQSVDRGRARVSTAVVHTATGDVAGITDIAAHLRQPDICFQLNTIVDPDHRGHGLGRVLKTHNHPYLLATLPRPGGSTPGTPRNASCCPSTRPLGFRVARALGRVAARPLVLVHGRRRLRRGLPLELGAVELGEQAARGEQLVVNVPALGDPAVLDDQDLVGVAARSTAGAR